jgi:hypothetical protein
VSRVGAQIEIAALPARVFAFFDDVDNASVLNPRVVEIVTVEPLENGGRRVEYLVRMASSGRESTVASEHVVYEPPTRTVARGYESGLATTTTRLFEGTERGTLVTTFVEWQLMSRFLGTLFTSQLRRPLRRSLHASLAAAKDAIER